MIKKHKISNYHILFLFIFFSYIYGISQFKDNTLIDTYDIKFHLSRIVGLSNSFNSPINFMTFGSFGQAVNLFYGWITIYPVYILYFVTGNLVTSYNIFLFIITFVTLISSYLSIFSIYKQKFVSLVFAILYAFSMYRTLCIFYRGAVGEVISMILYPIIFSAVYNIIINKKNYWEILSISFSLLFYTHVLSAVIAFLFILIIYLFTMVSKIESKKQLTITFLRAGLSSFMLSLFFLLPLLEQYNYQKINPPGKSDLQNRALYISELIGGAFKQELSSYSIGIILLILIFFSLICVYWFKYQYKFIFFIGLATLVVTTKLFPWELFQETPLQMIQFPWRLIGIATVFLCFTSSYLIKNFCKHTQTKIVTIILLSFLSIVLNVYSIANSPHYHNRIHSNDISTIIENTASNDYKPLGFEKYDYLTNNYDISIDGNIHKSEKEITNKSATFFIKASENQEIILPVYQYKGAHVFINNQKVDINQSNKPMISITAVQGMNEIKIIYKYTLLAKICFFISTIFLIYILKNIIKKGNYLL